MPGRRGRSRDRRSGPYNRDNARSRRQGGGDVEGQMARTVETQTHAEPAEIVRLSSDEEPKGNVQNPFDVLFPRQGIENEKSSQLSLTSHTNFDLPNTTFQRADDPLTMHVSKELWQKIWTGDYINLSLLLKKNADSTRGSSFAINEQGEIEIKPKAAKSIQTIREWTDAFLVFAAIMIHKSPNKANELLQYMAIIREAESRSAGSYSWRAYDEAFRMRQALQPQSWSEINADLWLRMMTLPAHPASLSRPSVTPPAPKLRPCFQFNSSNGCSFRQCKFDHVCLACRGTHSQQSCPRYLDQPFRGPTTTGPRATTTRPTKFVRP